jgi:hypothetical protein
MEIKSTIQKNKLVAALGVAIFILLLFPLSSMAQSSSKLYTIKNGKMHIELSKNLSEASLDSFITKHDLFDLDLKSFLKNNITDSLKKLGWELLSNTKDFFSLCKAMESLNNIKNPETSITFIEKNASSVDLFEAANKNVLYGVNKFANKKPFAINDSIVSFFLKDNLQAKKVFLAGTFNKWMPTDLPMTKTDSGWLANVKLGAGKYLYKFIIDDDWIIDTDNKISESDNEGNINSVLYFTNTVFKLTGYSNAKKVFVAGSFNSWKPNELKMLKTATGWELPLYIANGTYTYRFVADDDWFADPANPEKFVNEFNDYNSVLRIGKSTMFSLQGYTDAKKVILQGSFNGWRNNELIMNKTATGWELPYTLAAGNFEYRFDVDGKVVKDTNNKTGAAGTENSILILEPNYTFKIKGLNTAKIVLLAGDFNNWSPTGFAMKREGKEWVLPQHLTKGKHLYKLIVDGQWITDPTNALWEQNEFDTGNSIIWFE